MIAWRFELQISNSDSGEHESVDPPAPTAKEASRPSYVLETSSHRPEMSKNPSTVSFAEKPQGDHGHGQHAQKRAARFDNDLPVLAHRSDLTMTTADVPETETPNGMSLTGKPMEIAVSATDHGATAIRSHRLIDDKIVAKTKQAKRGEDKGFPPRPMIPSWVANVANYCRGSDDIDRMEAEEYRAINDRTLKFARTMANMESRERAFFYFVDQ